jgi:hypothetical protein
MSSVRSGRSWADNLRRVVLPAFAVGSIVLALTGRVVHRGGYYPGWDILGAAQGLHLIATRTPGEILRWLAEHHYDPGMGWSTYGVPLVLLPGWLALHWPWDYWTHVVTFVLTLASLWFVGRALGLRGEDWGILLLAWGASATLLTWSIEGFPYMSAAWPHALALWIVLRWREHWLATVLLSAVAIELSWHSQELGRTVFVVFFAAALFVRPTPWLTRVVWGIAGIWQLVDVWRHPTFNTARYSHVGFGSDAGERLLALGQRIFIEQYVDLPLLFVLGTAAAVLMRIHRWFWLGLLGAQVMLVVLLALNSGILQGVEGVWPRRFLMVSFLCLVTTVALYREAKSRPLAAGVLLGALLVGNAWQILDTLRWVRQPLDREGKGWDFPLPFTHNSLDSTVYFASVDWAREMRAEVERGKKVLLVYNLSSYEENATDPIAILERLYLQLGPERFSSSVFVHGSQTVRWNEFPIRPLRDLEPFVERLDPGEFVGYHRQHPRDEAKFLSEAQTILDTIERYWRIVWDPERNSAADPGRLRRFTLAPRSDAVPPN